MVVCYPKWELPDEFIGNWQQDGEYWSPEYTRRYYKWFIVFKDVRVKILLDYFNEDIGELPEILLSRLGDKIAKIMHGEQYSIITEVARGVIVETREILTSQGLAMAVYDLGILIAELLQREYSSLCWTIRKSRGKIKDIYHNHPVLEGFNNNMAFDPLLTLLNISANILENQSGVEKWINIYNYYANAVLAK